jgi:hypothetical protein
MKVYTNKKGVHKFRIRTEEYGRLDPLLDFQLIKIEKVSDITNGVILELYVLDRNKQPGEHSVVKTFWLMGTTVEITAQHRKLSLPDKITDLISYETDGKLRVVLQGEYNL